MAALQQMFTIGRLKPGEGLGEFRPMLVSIRQISRFELHKRLFTEIAPLLCFFFLKKKKNNDKGEYTTSLHDYDPMY